MSTDKLSINTPMGAAVLEAEEGQLTAVYLQDFAIPTILKKLRSNKVAIVKRPKSDPRNKKVLKSAQKQLAEYFAGRRSHFSLPMKCNGTPFQQKVWSQIMKIPHGKTKSYAEVALAIGKGRATRAVGTACGKNPFWIVVPCHRVLSSRGGLGGYAYGTAKKSRLLDLETTGVSQI